MPIVQRVGKPVAEKKLYLRVSLDGGGIYVQPLTALDVLTDEIQNSEVGAEWSLKLVEMTQAEYEALPEFEGH